MNHDSLKETSILPVYAKKYLLAIIDKEEELKNFLSIYKKNKRNLMKSIADFRYNKLESRVFTFVDFQQLYLENPKRAVEQLFLYPHNQGVQNSLIQPIEEKKISLESVYAFHQENPLYNPVLAGKKLLQLP